ncbi:NAD(P)H-hydrate dehydratase [Demequina sp. NBRC 110057]|uniref:NAD(P)H-hydrate dehydratase n=1 Tax=Demequina sp. NBRC 110057 TaxID=1570346 RepID=UPI0009FDF4D4|nr:NAD(P)H-hydrate dehydratase [Demequina sp. NBRC 110057]
MSDAQEWGADQVRERWAVPGAGDDKYSRGVVGVIAGSEAYPGAAALVVSGAARAGAGMVRYVGPLRAQDLVLHHRPEAVVHDPGDAAERLPRAQAWVVGSGVADYPEQDAAIGSAMASGAPLVVDAGALEAVARARATGSREAAADRVLLTPHAEELVRTLRALRHDVSLGDVMDDRAGHARLLAETARATVLLKGSRTVIASPGGTVVMLPEAPAWLATAGAGDVLAGIAGAALASGLSAADAGACASWLHARAGEVASAGGPLVALDIATAIPQAIGSILR